MQIFYPTEQTNACDDIGKSIVEKCNEKLYRMSYLKINNMKQEADEKIFKYKLYCACHVADIIF